MFLTYIFSVDRHPYFQQSNTVLPTPKIYSVFFDERAQSFIWTRIRHGKRESRARFCCTWKPSTDERKEEKIDDGLWRWQRHQCERSKSENKKRPQSTHTIHSLSHSSSVSIPADREKKNNRIEKQRTRRERRRRREYKSETRERKFLTAHCVLCIHNKSERVSNHGRGNRSVNENFQVSASI